MKNNVIYGLAGMLMLNTASFGAIPQIVSSPVTSVAVNGNYNYALEAIDADGDTLTWSVKPGTSLPSWLSFSGSTGTISTVAGNGSAGFSGDGGAATSAMLDDPTGIAFKGSTLVIADGNQYVIRSVDTTTGIISTIAGSAGVYGYTGDGGLASNALLARIDGPALITDSAHNIYAAGLTDWAVRQINSTGIINTVAGTAGTAGYSGDGGLATSATMRGARGIAFDQNDNLYIADTQSHSIRKVDATTGIISTIAGSDTSGYSGDGGSATGATFNNPEGIAVDNNGDIYIADTFNNVIRKIDGSNNIITTIAGTGTQGYTGDGGLATAAQLFHPVGITFDQDNIYFADRFNSVVRKINRASGVISTVIGNGSAGYSGDGGAPSSAQLNGPTTLAFDSNGNLYVSDRLNHVVRKASLPSASLSGTPTQADVGNHTVAFIVSDGVNEVEHTFTVAVGAPANPNTTVSVPLFGPLGNAVMLTLFAFFGIRKLKHTKA